MEEFPENNTITVDGDYHLTKVRHGGRPVSIEICGVFDGATVIPGYVSEDTVPVFVTDVGDDELARPKTAAGRWVSTIPASGLVGVRVSGAGASTAIIVSVQDLLPR